jgi:hypothetical protein
MAGPSQAMTTLNFQRVVQRVALNEAWCYPALRPDAEDGLTPSWLGAGLRQ